MVVRRIGVDLALTTAHKAVVLEGADRLRALTVPMDREGFDLFLSRATGDASGPCEFVMEPTGSVWPIVGALLLHEGHRVSLVNGQKVAAARSLLSRYCKTDVVDCEALARVPMLDPARGTYAFPDFADGRSKLRRVVAQRHRLVRDSTRHKLRITAVCQGANTHLLRALGSDRFAAVNRVILRHCLDPFEVQRLGELRFAATLREQGAKRLRKQRVTAVFEASCKMADLLEPLRSSGTLPLEYEQLQQEVNLEFDILETIESKIQELQRQSNALYQEIDPDQVLTTLPGVGEVVSATLEAHLGQVDRFRNVEAFVSFCGVAPRRRQTGNSRGVDGLRITKAGQAFLRKVLYLAAFRAVRCDPEFASAYSRFRQRGLHHNKALIALANKLARRAYALLKRRARGEQAVAYQFRTTDGRRVSRDEALAEVQELSRAATPSATTAAPTLSAASPAVVPQPPSNDREESAASDQQPEIHSTVEFTSPGRESVGSGQPGGSASPMISPGTTPISVLAKQVLDTLVPPKGAADCGEPCGKSAVIHTQNGPDPA